MRIEKMKSDGRRIALKVTTAGFPSLILLVCLLLLTTPGLRAQDSSWDWENGQVGEKHEVKVEAQVLPFYAIDKNGNPVFDLKQEDIQVLIDKKPVKAIYFERYEFASDVKGEEKGETVPAKVSKISKRFVFLIQDSVFNSPKGLERSTKILTDIIKRSPKGDAFILLDNSTRSGLKYIAGPTADRGFLLDKLNELSKINTDKLLEDEFRLLEDEISQSDSAFQKSLFKPRAKKLEHEVYGNKVPPSDLSIHSMATPYQVIKRNQLMAFSSSLLQLEYALKTITRPKIVYLVSQGVPQKVMPGAEKIFYSEYLINAAKGVNRGGSLLYIIDPNPTQMMAHEDNSGKEALKLMADAGNGKYFGGSDNSYISERLARSTSAYYEIGFYVPARKQMKLNVTARRKGVTIYSINQIQRKTPYKRMDTFQQKIFALNVITGGKWSRMIADIKETECRTIKVKRKKEKTVITAEARLPEKLHGRLLHIYTINIDPKTMKANIEMKHDMGDENIRFKAIKEENRDQYFVIIEPDTASCLSNRIL